jgi:hypothetical protein
MDGRTAVCHNKPYFDGRIKMNGPYPEITNISSLAKLFFKTFISLKHLSDYRRGGFRGGAPGARPPLKLEKI